LDEYDNKDNAIIAHPDLKKPVRVRLETADRDAEEFEEDAVQEIE